MRARTQPLCVRHDGSPCIPVVSAPQNEMSLLRVSRPASKHIVSCLSLSRWVRWRRLFRRSNVVHSTVQSVRWGRSGLSLVPRYRASRNRVSWSSRKAAHEVFKRSGLHRGDLSSGQVMTERKNAASIRDMTPFFLTDSALKSPPICCTSSRIIAHLITNSKFTHTCCDFARTRWSRASAWPWTSGTCWRAASGTAVAITASKAQRSLLFIPNVQRITIVFTVVGGSNVSLLKRSAAPW